MTATIKYNGDKNTNPTRYGRVIPHTSKTIDICNYFGVTEDRAEFIASQLMSDKNIDCNLQTTAGEESKKRNEEIIKKAKESKTGREKRARK